MKFLVLLAVLLLPSALLAATSDAEFEKMAQAYIEQYLQRNPEQATELGDHRFDDRLTDYSPDSFAKARATAKDFQQRVGQIDASKLTGPNKIDAQILKDAIDYEIF